VKFKISNSLGVLAPRLIYSFKQINFGLRLASEREGATLFLLYILNLKVKVKLRKRPKLGSLAKQAMKS